MLFVPQSTAWAWCLRFFCSKIRSFLMRHNAHQIAKTPNQMQSILPFASHFSHETKSLVEVGLQFQARNSLPKDQTNRTVGHWKRRWSMDSGAKQRGQQPSVSPWRWRICFLVRILSCNTCQAKTLIFSGTFSLHTFYSKKVSVLSGEKAICTETWHRNFLPAVRVHSRCLVHLWDR